ncbi:MAG TPA: redoxin domain-containing protein, partial [Polyangiales bacterium]|nr:redoxin domain-containing protein [Polyangiales bacterium]
MKRARWFFATCFLLCAACDKPAAPRPSAEPQTPVTSAAPASAESKLIAPGAPAPDLVMHAHTGETVQLSKLRGRPIVVYFYPKDDTPGCTVEAQELRDLS